MWNLVKLTELLGVVSVVNGLTIWAMKRLLDGQREAFAQQIRQLATRNAGQDDDIQQVRDDLNEFKVTATRQFIHREDALIYFGRFEQKIDAIWSHLMDSKNRGQ